MEKLNFLPKKNILRRKLKIPSPVVNYSRHSTNFSIDSQKQRKGDAQQSSLTF